MDAIEAAITEVPDATNVHMRTDVHNRADTVGMPASMNAAYKKHVAGGRTDQCL